MSKIAMTCYNSDGLQLSTNMGHHELCTEGDFLDSTPLKQEIQRVVNYIIQAPQHMFFRFVEEFGFIINQ